MDSAVSQPRAAADGLSGAKAEITDLNRNPAGVWGMFCKVIFIQVFRHMFYAESRSLYTNVFSLDFNIFL